MQSTIAGKLQLCAASLVHNVDIQVEQPRLWQGRKTAEGQQQEYKARKLEVEGKCCAEACQTYSHEACAS